MKFGLPSEVMSFSHSWSNLSERFSSQPAKSIVSGYKWGACSYNAHLASVQLTAFSHICTTVIRSELLSFSLSDLPQCSSLHCCICIVVWVKSEAITSDYLWWNSTKLQPWCLPLSFFPPQISTFHTSFLNVVCLPLCFVSPSLKDLYFSNAFSFPLSLPPTLSISVFLSLSLFLSHI